MLKNGFISFCNETLHMHTVCIIVISHAPLSWLQSAWLQTILRFLVRAQKPIWVFPLVAWEGGCSLRVGIYQMLLPLWGTIIDLGSAGSEFPPSRPTFAQTLPPSPASGGSFNNFWTIKISDMKWCNLLHWSFMRLPFLLYISHLSIKNYNVNHSSPQNMIFYGYCCCC